MKYLVVASLIVLALVISDVNGYIRNGKREPELVVNRYQNNLEKLKRGYKEQQFADGLVNIITDYNINKINNEFYVYSFIYNDNSDVHQRLFL